MNYYLLYDGGIVDDSGAKQKWLHFPRAREIITSLKFYDLY